MADGGGRLSAASSIFNPPFSIFYLPFSFGSDNSQGVNEPNPTKPFAWEPLTPPGVAAFAGASWGRLWSVQFIVALLVAATVVWFLKTAWFPVVSAAIRELPAQGEIRDGKLSGPITAPQLLAESRFLAFVVDLQHEGQVRSPAQVQVEFGRNDIQFFSLLGYQQFDYPTGRSFVFNRIDLEPKWGAWQPPVLWLTFGAVVAGLMLSWTLLATVYCLPVWLAGFFANRHLNFGASWKLAGAALLPGALLLTAAILFYGLGMLDLVQLAAAFAAHFLIGWIYLFAAPLFAPKLEIVAGPKQNPFAGTPQTNTEAGSAPAKD